MEDISGHHITPTLTGNLSRSESSIYWDPMAVVTCNKQWSLNPDESYGSMSPDADTTYRMEESLTSNSLNWPLKHQPSSASQPSMAGSDNKAHRLTHGSAFKEKTMESSHLSVDTQYSDVPNGYQKISDTMETSNGYLKRQRQPPLIIQCSGGTRTQHSSSLERIPDTLFHVGNGHHCVGSNLEDAYCGLPFRRASMEAKIGSTDSRIISSRGTVRGFRNRVKAGIATFLERQDDKQKTKVRYLYTLSCFLLPNPSSKL